MTYSQSQRELATAWKTSTPTLPDAARVPAAYRSASADATTYPFCLPHDFASHNLLPEVRQRALGLFAELGITWHAAIAGGPTNHLLSSQVQCVNALTAMVDEPARILLAFGDVVDVAEVLEIEPGRFLTFEFISERDYLAEAGPRGTRTRGANCTSVDAAFRYRTSDGRAEVALIEWKYTESYLRPRPASPEKDVVRAGRYERLYDDPAGPLHPLVPFELMLDEPFYQLMRQQLLADQLERDPAYDADTVRVLHVLSPANDDYQRSIVRPEMRELGDTVDQIWSQLLRRPDRFRHVDPNVFLDPAVTSQEYVARYSS